jgi:cytochrome b561
MDTEPVVIDSDLPCAICGYNLKGLSVDANCPECGQSVARSYTPDLLRSNPQWLRHQANTMLLLGALCLVNFQPFNYSLRGFQVWIGFGILLSIATVWACWRLATPEPPGPPADGEATLQRMLRLAPIIYAAVRIGSLVSSSFHPTLISVIGITALVCLLLTNGLVGYFLLRLARRSNDRQLILHARIVAWAFPFSQAGDVLLYFVGFIFSRTELSQAIYYNTLGVLHWLLAAVVYFTLLLMGRMHETLRAAAKTAEAEQTVSNSPTS